MGPELLLLYSKLLLLVETEGAWDGDWDVIVSAQP